MPCHPRPPSTIKNGAALCSWKIDGWKVILSCWNLASFELLGAIQNAGKLSGENDFWFYETFAEVSWFEGINLDKLTLLNISCSFELNQDWFANNDWFGRANLLFAALFVSKKTWSLATSSRVFVANQAPPTFTKSPFFSTAALKVQHGWMVWAWLKYEWCQEIDILYGFIWMIYKWYIQTHRIMHVHIQYMYRDVQRCKSMCRHSISSFEVTQTRTAHRHGHYASLLAGLVCRRGKVLTSW